jgi:hypothetical protein
MEIQSILSLYAGNIATLAQHACGAYGKAVAGVERDVDLLVEAHEAALECGRLSFVSGHELPESFGSIPALVTGWGMGWEDARENESIARCAGCQSTEDRRLDCPYHG